jgi:hypothetical protein
MRLFVLSRVLILSLIALVLNSHLAEAAPVYQQCGQVAITSPTADVELRGIVPIEGSASFPDFQFYKVEYSTVNQPNLWRAVSQTYGQPVVNGVLDQWNTTVLGDGGGYSLKLTGVDNRAQEICQAIVRNLTIANDEPTATPTPEQPPTLPAPTATATPRGVAVATATPAPPTPTATVAAIIPTREATFPELDTIRDTVTAAFDVDRMQEMLLLGAGTTTAVLVFLGLVSVLRRLI